MAFIAHAREDVPALLDEIAQLREIAQAVAAIHETGYGDPALPYDAQVSALTILKARKLLGIE